MNTLYPVCFLMCLYRENYIFFKETFMLQFLILWELRGILGFSFLRLPSREDAVICECSGTLLP